MKDVLAGVHATFEIEVHVVAARRLIFDRELLVEIALTVAFFGVLARVDPQFGGGARLFHRP